MVTSRTTPGNDDPDTSNNVLPEPAAGGKPHSFLEYFELCERIHYASVIDGITPLNVDVIQARCTWVDPHYLRPASLERVYVVNLDATHVTFPQGVVQEVLESYADALRKPATIGSSTSKAMSKFCFVSCARQFLLYTSLDFVLYLVPGVERLTSIQVNDLTFLLGEIARQQQDIPFTYELSFSLLLQPWFQQMFPDGQLSGLPDNVERSIKEQFWWRDMSVRGKEAPAAKVATASTSTGGSATSQIPSIKAASPLPSVKTAIPTKTLPHIPRVKTKELVQETSSAYKDLLPYLLSLAWDSQRFNSPPETTARLLAGVASWKRVQHLEASEPIEWSDLALATIFRGLNLNDWKFSACMQLRTNVALIDARPKMQFQCRNCGAAGRWRMQDSNAMRTPATRWPCLEPVPTCIVQITQLVDNRSPNSNQSTMERPSILEKCSKFLV
ncbi:MAG: hypothetical protein GYA24_15535 [Candidatus Lokiarchaeota archaeon]|nr:hypothetical protein [Candidatus Lokiarchaeota archaeon]